MSRVPPPKTGSGSLSPCATRSRLRRRTRRGSGRTLRRRPSPAARDALACRLMKRSALLLLASAARSSRPTVVIAVAGQDDAHAEPRFERGLQPPGDAQRDCSSRACRRRRARRPRSPPWPASITIVRSAAGRRQVEERRQAPAMTGGVGAGRLRLRLRSSARHVDHEPAGAAIARGVGGSERREAGPEIDGERGRGVAGADVLNEVGRRGGRQGRVERVRLEANHEAAGLPA